MRHSLRLLFLVLLAGPLAAQEPAAEDAAEEIRRYQVDVIVFRYAESVAVGNEVFLPEEQPAALTLPVLITPVPPPATPGRGGRPAPAGLPAPDALVPEPEFLLAPPGEFPLQDVLGRLEQLSVYEPVFQASWTQQAVEENEAISMELDMLGVPPATLNGRFRMYLSRFLHLVVELDYTPDTGPVLPVAIELPGAGERPTPAELSYRIREDRIFRSGETRYFDHPKFGVIARITRVEETDPDASSGDELVDQGVNSAL